jgi:hypothetical protein
MNSHGKLLATALLTAGSLTVTGLGVAVAASGHKTDTLSFISKETSDKQLPGNHFVDTDKDVAHGKYAGNDILTGHSNNKTATASGDVVFAREGGVIYGQVHLDFKTGAITGTVTGGAGKFAGAAGTITGNSLNDKDASLTITYRR